MWGDMGRCGEISGEIWGDVGRRARDSARWPASCRRSLTPILTLTLTLPLPLILTLSHPAVSSQILFTTTTYGCLHVERIQPVTSFTLMPNPNPNPNPIAVASPVGWGILV